ncbi:MAG: type II CAAX endopeptidase family protein [Gammaproteobacteria bacterium]
MDKECLAPGDHHPSKKMQLVEVGIFLLLIGPSIVLSSFTAVEGSLTFSRVAMVSIFQDVALVLLIFYFLWRNHEPLNCIGWAPGRGSMEIVLGTALFFPMVVGVGLLETLLRSAGLPLSEMPPAYLIPNGFLQMALALVFLIVVAISEEVIFRGYLIFRFTALLGRPGVALFLAAIIFSVGHGYQGAGSILAAGFLGVILGLVYMWRKNLIAPITMHFLQNFSGIILASLQEGT